MIDSPEDFRYLHPSGKRTEPFRAVSIEDAVSFVRLHYCPNASERTARGRLDCYFAGRWVRVLAYDRFLRER